jgi:hypothetical protein
MKTMNSEYWFGELAHSLKNGFFADSVVLELARISRAKGVSDEQKGLFWAVTDVLQQAVEGSRWLDDPKMSEKASRCASFFGQAVEAMSVSMTTEAFVREVEKLKQTANALASGEVPSDQKLKELRKFFFNTGRTELEKTEDLMSGEKETDRLRWLAAR